jgi:D-alanyl-D-alanine carboxypeptidase
MSLTLLDIFLFRTPKASLRHAARVLPWLLLLTTHAVYAAPSNPNPRPLVRPEISARAAVLLNPVSGQVLFAKNPHRRLPQASTTKVMTTLLALEHLDLNTKIPVSQGAANTEPSRIGLRPGEVMYVHDLLYGLMLKSGNDAAEVVAEAIGGSVAGFATLMNAKAQQLGAANTSFRNPHGLDADGHYSTAYDLVLIFRHAMENPVFAEIVRTRRASLRVESGDHSEHWRFVPVRNTNKLLTSYPGANGGKTGYTSKARRCYVGEVQRGPIRLIVSLLGSTRRWQDAKALLDYGFAYYGRGKPTAPPTNQHARAIEPLKLISAAPSAQLTENRHPVN